MDRSEQMDRCHTTSLYRKHTASAWRLLALLLAFLMYSTTLSAADYKTVQSGNWSDAGIWDLGSVPGQGDNVQIDSGHVVIYDVNSSDAVRLIHIQGRLEFSRTVSTQLDVGMIIVNTRETVDPNQDCSITDGGYWPDAPRPALEVGTIEDPIPAGITARIRLVYFSDMDPDCAPGIINYGGRMDIHGAPLTKTWVEMGASARSNDNTVVLDEAVNWQPGDRILITGADIHEPPHDQHSYRHYNTPKTEERIIQSISNGTVITLNSPLTYDHRGQGWTSCEVANMTRNVIIESRDPNGVTGHTMYHYDSRGSISYAAFNHLGKEGVLARYPIHYHILRDTNRGSSVIGSVIEDSRNRFVTIHATDYLVVRDNIGYKSVGHGFFMEDGSEVYNIVDHNLAILAYDTSPLPNQAIPEDENDGAGFWYANALNSFTRNVAVECDRYGFAFETNSNIITSVLQPDGSIQNNVQVDQLPYIRFDGNETHGIIEYAYWGAGNASANQPFHIRNFNSWLTWRVMAAQGDNYHIEDVQFWNVAYVWYGKHTRNVKVNNLNGKRAGFSFMGMAGRDPQGLQTFENVSVDTFGTNYPYVIAGRNERPPVPTYVHVRNFSCTNNLNPGIISKSHNDSYAPAELTLWLHDYYGPDQDAKIIPYNQSRNDGLTYYQDPPTFENTVKIAVDNQPWPNNPIGTVDDMAPVTAITYPVDEQIFDPGTGQVTIHGSCADASNITGVTVNGVAATATSPNFNTWTVTVNLSSGLNILEATATDEFGNVEQNPHRIKVGVGIHPTGIVRTGDTDQLAENFQLIGNYPNPFNPETNIQFSVPENAGTFSQVTVSVFDMSGRLVRQLLNRGLSAGEYEVTWDAQNDYGQEVSSGVYIYEMTAITSSNRLFRQARKMILMK